MLTIVKLFVFVKEHKLVQLNFPTKTGAAAATKAKQNKKQKTKTKITKILLDRLSYCLSSK